MCFISSMICIFLYKFLKLFVLFSVDVLARDTIDSTQPSFNNTMGPAIRQSRMESMSPHSPSLTGAPYIQIVEQPAPKETRFRYL